MTGKTTYKAPISIGKTLKELREGKNITLNDIASKMRLEVRFISAIEEDNFDSLPDPIYVRGYIRSYSKLLGADADALVRTFEEHGGNFEPEIIPEIRHSSQTSSSDKPVKAFTYLIMLALVVLLIVWWQNNFVINSPTVSPETISQIREEQVVEPVYEAPAYALPEYRPADTSDNLQEIPVVPTGTQRTTYGMPVESTTIEPTLESTTPAIVIDPLPGALPPAMATDVALDPMGTPVTGEVLAVTPTATPGAIDPATAQSTPATVTAGTDTDMMTGMTPFPTQGVTSSPQTPVYQTTGPDSIVLKLTAHSWIEIIDANSSKVFFNLGRPGDIFNVRGTAPFDVLLGVAQAVSVEFNGKPFNAAPYSRAGVARFTLGE